jgi:hypothetical protein
MKNIIEAPEMLKFALNGDTTIKKVKTNDEKKNILCGCIGLPFTHKFTS